MTELERATCSPGFLVGVLETWRVVGQGGMAFRARLYDGGRCVQETRAAGRVLRPEAVAELANLLGRLASPPHVLVVCGRGWRELLLRSGPAALAGLRVLDLLAAAIALEPSLRPRAPLAHVAQAYRVPVAEGEEIFDSDAVERLFWALVRRAGERGLDWPRLLRYAEERRSRPDFSACEFDANTLAELPAAPGVYLMRDAAGRPLYVGKSANLARRVNEYFRDAERMSAKLAAIRGRVRRIEYRLVGSELEALLVENRWIAELGPELNVQRRIAEGRGRYGELPVPVVILERSALAGAAELFFVGGRPTAIQLRVRPARRAGKLLETTVDFFLNRTPRLRRGRGLADWGAVGREICTRYFMAERNRLHWCEITPRLQSPEGRARLLQIAAKILTEPPMPGEYRGA